MDRADCVAMACYRLMELRNAEALDKEVIPSDFGKIFSSVNHNNKKNNPFGSGINPFRSNGNNPFN